MDIAALKNACKGVVATADDANFLELIHGNLWNRLIPDRAPQIVVRVNDEQDVIAAILFARSNKLKVVVRGGGMSWNQGVWGHGAASVEAVELVTAEGKLITASKDGNQDYFWAARGAGSGFFGVATRYHLKLYPLPKAIHGCSYYYPLEEAASVAKWLGETAGNLAPSVELSLFLLTAPPELKATTSAQGGKVCLVAATSFADSPEQAKAELKPLDECPVISRKLSHSPPAPVNFEELFDASGALWPEGLRNRVQAIFSNSDPKDLVQTMVGHLISAPSPISLILFVFFTGPDVPPKLPEGAYSMSARIYGGPWTQWKDASDDAANSAWHRECVSLLTPFIQGYYIGESDTVGGPSAAQGAFSPENWNRLAALRAKHDPEGVFFNYSDGFSAQKHP